MSHEDTSHEIYLGPAELRSRLREMAKHAGINCADLPASEDDQRALTISEVVTAAELLNVSSEELLLREPHAAPLFRNEGGAEAAREAQVRMESIMDDYLSFKSVVGG